MRDAIRLRPGLYASRIVRADPREAGVIVWSPGGPAARIDADAVLASDLRTTTVLARRGGTPLLFQIPATFDGAAPPLRALTAPPEPKWADGSMAMLDDAHVVIEQSTVRALPSLEVVAVWPSSPLAVAGKTALFEASNAKGERYFDVVDALTGAQRFALPPPTAQVVDTARSMFDGPAYAANLSPDGTRVAYADSTGLWLADVTTKPAAAAKIAWRSISTTPFASYRGTYGVSFAEDNAFVCLTTSGNASIFPVTASPAAHPAAKAVALPSGSGGDACEVIYLPVIAGLEPLGYLNDKFYSAIDPWLVDPARRWVLWLHQDANGNVEVVLAEPSSGKLVRRVAFLERPAPSADGEPTMRAMSVSAGPPGFARVSVSLDAKAREALVDVVNGDVVAPADLPPVKWTGSHCLHEDGALTAASTCDP